jgi:hypothetical protein
MQTWRTAQ